MSYYLFSRPLLSAIVSAALAAACSSQSPFTPTASSAATGDLGARAGADASGVYTLSFNVFSGGALQEVPSLTVKSQELILKAYVMSASGAPARKGTVTFEYCPYNGLPPGDITRADEAPKEACDAGTASWARLRSLAVSGGTCPGLGTGYACLDFGIVRILRDVGFRFRYSPQGSGIAG